MTEECLFPRDYCPFLDNHTLCDFADKCIKREKRVGVRKTKQYAKEHYSICVFVEAKKR